MSLSELDLQLGQLLLAKGDARLFELLEATSEAADGNRRLTDVLVSRGIVDEQRLADRSDELDQMDAGERKRTAARGDTVAMWTIADHEQREHRKRLEEQSDVIGTVETLDYAPESRIGDESTDPEDILRMEGLEWPRGGDRRYEMFDELGRGGMGIITRARDRLLDREIAVKALRPEKPTERQRRQLVAEAQLTGKLEHPSIIPVYEMGRFPDGHPYYTMRVAPERNLATVIDRMKEGDDDVPSMSRLAQILRQVCQAVGYAHERGVVHRDLKPDNILLGDYGEVFVIDWGVAKIRSSFDHLPNPTTASQEQEGSVVGTPRYMAPEQARGDMDAVDQCTDIYAVGAILYELLTLTPVFEYESVLGLLVDVVRESPESPSQRAPDREIPPPLEEICMRALAKKPADRYPSARAMAEELDLYIEGVKDRQRNERRARKLIDQAREVFAEYETTREQLQEVMRRHHRLDRSIPGSAPPEERSAVWRAVQDTKRLERELEQKFGETTRLLSQSLGYRPLDEAQQMLASMYWQRFVEAERRGDPQMAAHFEGLVRQHDTGAYADRLEGLADLSVDVEPQEAEVTLFRVDEYQLRLVPRRIVDRTTGRLVAQKIPHGRYRLLVEAEGYHPVSMPVHLDRLDEQHHRLRLWPEDEIPEDFAVVPSGEYVAGPPDDFDVGADRVYLDEFAIKQTPVTCGEYLEFLNDLAGEDVEKAKSHAPRTNEDAESYFPLVDGRFVLPESDPEGDSWNPDWPIFIVNYHDAVAYARWRSERDGRTYLLPSSAQWEKAARGLDGRIYPWGLDFDPSFCHMRDSAEGKPMPAAVGSYGADISPYGVVDMAGNICEWTRTPAEHTSETMILRGGAFNSVALTCRLHWYQNSPASFRFAHYGFRLVMELGEE